MHDIDEEYEWEGELSTDFRDNDSSDDDISSCNITVVLKHSKNEIVSK